MTAAEWLDTPRGQSWLNHHHHPLVFNLAVIKSDVYSADCYEWYDVILWEAPRMLDDDDD